MCENCITTAGLSTLTTQVKERSSGISNSVSYLNALVKKNKINFIVCFSARAHPDDDIITISSSSSSSSSDQEWEDDVEPDDAIFISSSSDEADAQPIGVYYFAYFTMQKHLPR